VCPPPAAHPRSRSPSPPPPARSREGRAQDAGGARRGVALLCARVLRLDRGAPWRALVLRHGAAPLLDHLLHRHGRGQHARGPRVRQHHAPHHREQVGDPVGGGRPRAHRARAVGEPLPRPRARRGGVRRGRPALHPLAHAHDLAPDRLRARGGLEPFLGRARLLAHLGVGAVRGPRRGGRRGGGLLGHRLVRHAPPRAVDWGAGRLCAGRLRAGRGVRLCGRARGAAPRAACRHRRGHRAPGAPGAL
jgi:hypothetical protein